MLNNYPQDNKHWSKSPKNHFIYFCFTFGHQNDFGLTLLGLTAMDSLGSVELLFLLFALLTQDEECIAKNTGIELINFFAERQKLSPQYNFFVRLTKALENKYIYILKWKQNGLLIECKGNDNILCPCFFQIQ